MEIKSKQRLQALEKITADWKSSLNDVESDKVKSVVNSLASVVAITHLNTDGFDSGCEVHFHGKQKSDVSYGDNVLGADALAKVAAAMKSVEMAELHPSETSGEFILVLAD